MPRTVSPAFPEFTKGQDTLTRYGAGVLADYIDQYWRTRGYLGIQTEKYELPGSPGVYGVRSNMVGGVPPRNSALQALMAAGHAVASRA